MTPARDAAEAPPPGAAEHTPRRHAVPARPLPRAVRNIRSAAHPDASPRLPPESHNMTVRPYSHVAAAMSLLALAPLATPAFAQGRSTSVSVPSDRLATLPTFIDGVVAQQIATREVAGAVVTVVHRGRVIMSRGDGPAECGPNVPAASP